MVSFSGAGTRGLSSDASSFLLLSSGPAWTASTSHTRQ